MKPQHRRYWDEFKDHTLFKHLVLEGYAHAWMQKVVRGRRANRLLVVDAFAGRGSDRAGNPGSPLRLARAATLAKDRLESDLGWTVPVHVVAIEQEPEWFRELLEFMKPFGASVEVFQGSLKDHHARILAEHSGVPALYFLDPFGVKGLEADQVALALRGEASEALVLFNDPGAERLVGAAGGGRRDDDDPLTLALFNEPPTSPEVTVDQAQEEPEWADGAAYREILNTAFGDDRWARAIDGMPSGPARRDVLIRLYEGLLQELGAPYTTRIPVWRFEGRREYTLLHASKSPHGRMTMKEAVHAALRSCNLPEGVKEHARLDMHTKLEHVFQRVLEEFKGQTVHWAEAHDPSLRKFVLMETEMCHAQLDELKARLSSYRVAGRGPELYNFTQ